MRVVLPFKLEGQTLVKQRGFPKSVADGSKDSIVIKVDGIPDGCIAKGYFRLSWENNTLYDLTFDGDELVVSEYITTLPKNATNKYIDYKFSFSLAIWEGNEERLTTNPVEVIVEKSNYSDETTNTPEIPENQYNELMNDLAEVIDLANDLNADVGYHGREIKRLNDEKLSKTDIEEYAYAICDKDGNIVFAVDNDGKVVFVSENADMEAELQKLRADLGRKLDKLETDEYAYAVCDNNGNVVFAITNNGEVKYIGAGSGGASVATTFDYTKCGLPVLYLDGDTSGMSKEDAVELTYTFKTPKDIAYTSGICECKWQGSSSVSRGYPKRNYTLKFYKSEKVDGELVKNKFEATSVWTKDGDRVVNFEKPWGEQYKYCAKANWIDPSGARNVVCARLWGAIVADRAERYGTVPEKLLETPNNGAIDGFPTIIVINGEFTGLYTFNVPKDDWTFNMGDGETEYVVGCESNSHEYPSCRWSGPATFEGEEDYAIEVIPDNVDESVLISSFNAAIDAMVNATQSSQWETDVAPYFDVDAAIDYMIFVCCIGGRDNRRKNILYGTYDGQKWFMSAYDLDTTFGANVHNKGWYPIINDVNQFYEISTWHRVFSYIYKFSKGRLKKRYKELREGILSDENVWYVLNNFVSDIPITIYNMDAERWADKLDNAPGYKKPMLSTAAANVNNYMHYYRMHCAYLDKEIDAMQETEE